MTTLRKLTGRDFPDTQWEPDGYDEKQVPTNTIKNFNILLEEHNKLVEVVKKLRVLTI